MVVQVPGEPARLLLLKLPPRDRHMKVSARKAVAPPPDQQELALASRVAAFVVLVAVLPQTGLEQEQPLANRGETGGRRTRSRSRHRA